MKKILNKYLNKFKYRISEVLIYKQHIESRNKKVLSAWAYYKLGMYSTASQLHTQDKTWHDLFAKGISHAACGEYDRAKTYIDKLASIKKYKMYLLPFADALAPYMPKEALALVERFAHPPIALHAGLLLKTCQVKKAKIILEVALNAKHGRKIPELFLYYSNTLNTIDIHKKMTLINKFFLYHKLEGVRLKDKQQSLSVNNLECKKVFDSNLKKSPLVSILMTTYETKNRVHHAIESILAQSYHNFELIIVDDASKDETSEILSEWAKKDPRIQCIFLEKNSGTYIAKNTALLQAKGQFITCHDSDDWSHPKKLEMQVKPLLTNKKLIGTLSCWVRLDDEGFYYARPVHPLMRLNPSSLMFRKDEVLKYAGIWDCVRTGADSEFIARLRAVFGRKSIKKISKPLALGAHRYDSLMNASDTGYNENSVSNKRLSYWESWAKWHINELQCGRKPFLGAETLQQHLG